MSAQQRKMLSLVTLILLMFFFSNLLLVSSDNQVSFEEIQKKLEDQKRADALEDFKGFGFGLGISLSFYFEKRVDDAKVVNDLVRVTEEASTSPRIMLESHYFFPLRKNHIGIGPFVCILSSSKEVIDAMGGGIMFGFRRSLDKSDSFNFGIGLVNDTKIKILGDEIEENEPLPDGETEIRFKTKSAIGLIIMFSFAF